MNIALWIVQVLLALMFLFAGGTKLVMSAEQMAAMGSPNQIHLSGLFLKFLGVVEVLGALGLVLPGLFRTRTVLTPLAAAGLFIIMVGAVVITIMGEGVGQTVVVPFVCALLSAFVAYGRWKLRPLG
jgi:uncharacterized membrane protein YphA (DoxX/SURF4 family)